MQTRFRSGISQPKIRTGGAVTYSDVRQDDLEPVSVTAALANP